MQVVIEDWDGDGAIHIPDEVLQELGVDVGDSLYLIEEYVGSTRCLVLSKTPQIPDRIDELVNTWDEASIEIIWSSDHLYRQAVLNRVNHLPHCPAARLSNEQLDRPFGSQRLNRRSQPVERTFYIAVMELQEVI
jgi:bifunctional DNA-binding transcriptional regulator/antitoxin component of YhaV-PrlF toxin-antitoxin module